MKSTQFTIPGKPIGFYVVGKVPNRKRMKQYHTYQDVVRYHALMAGISLPLQATKDKPLSINTVAYFPDGVHCDPGNVQKGICDALFYAPRGQKRGNDKYTGGFFMPPLYDKENPRVVVTIEESILAKLLNSI